MPPFDRQVTQAVILVAGDAGISGSGAANELSRVDFRKRFEGIRTGSASIYDAHPFINGAVVQLTDEAARSHAGANFCGQLAQNVVVRWGTGA